jgi:hypothetical protein
MIWYLINEVRIPVKEYLGVMWDYTSKGETDYLPDLGLFIPMKVKKVYSNPDGKYPKSWSRLMLIEYSQIMPLLLPRMAPYLSATELQRLKSLDIYGKIVLFVANYYRFCG